MSDDNPVTPPRKRIDAFAVRRHLFRELGVDVDVDASETGAVQDSHATGYKNPPHQTRFVKGRSGNPMGRPKKEKRSQALPFSDDEWTSFEQGLVTHALLPMTVRDNGKLREVDVVQGILGLVKQRAAKGSVRMIELWLRQIERAALLKAESLAREHAQWQDYIDTYSDRMRLGIARGQPLPDWMPHPEDVIIESGKPVRFQGYAGEETYKDSVLLKQVRDTFNLRMLYDNEIFFARPGSKTSVTGPDLAVFLLDRWLPKRWQFHAAEHQKNLALWTWASRDSRRVQLKEAFTSLGWPLDLTKPAPYVSDKHLKKLGLDPKWVHRKVAA